jgi:hypothetical protein
VSSSLKIVSGPWREAIMDKMENILYSLIPLIIIILISWAFSFLGSKRRGRQDSAETETQTTPGDQFLDFISEEDDEDEKLIVRSDDGRSSTGPHVDLDVWAPDVPTGGPEVTPKPIKPKWWGA